MTSPFGPLVAIVDPEAGPHMRDALPVLERALKERDLEHSISVAEAPGEATGLAAEALAGGTRYLVAVGNDRTVQDVVNGMFADGHPLVEDAVLGVVPAGTGSDLVMSFGLADDTEGACAHLDGANTYPFDLMKVVYAGPQGARLTRYAANLAEVGMGGEIGRRMDGRPGDRRRFLAFWSGWLRSKPTDVTVSVDTKTWKGRAFNVIVGNGQFTSGGMRMSPRSFPGDGVLDALIFTGPRSDAYTMLPKIYRHGDHIPDPNIKEMRAKIRIAVDAERPLAVVADGVPLGTTPAMFQVVPQQIRLKL
jgi:diacylglycerol kinase (ATP)